MLSEAGLSIFLMCEPLKTKQKQNQRRCRPFQKCQLFRMPGSVILVCRILWPLGSRPLGRDGRSAQREPCAWHPHGAERHSLRREVFSREVSHSPHVTRKGGLDFLDLLERGKKKNRKLYLHLLLLEALLSPFC